MASGKWLWIKNEKVFLGYLLIPLEYENSQIYLLSNRTSDWKPASQFDIHEQDSEKCI